MKPTSRDRRPVVHSHDAAFVRLEPLEPRQLLAAYVAEPVDLANVPRTVFSLEAPEGVESAGFGATAVVLGDIDGDGLLDFAIAAPGAAGSDEGGVSAVRGVVFVYSGGDQSLLATIAGASHGFGQVLDKVGDFNDDGRTDLVIGSPVEGVVEIYSAFNGALIRRFYAGPDTDFGFDFAVLADMNAGGLPEIAVGAPRFGGPGAVFVISGEDGSQIYRLDGAQNGDLFGQSVEAVRDMGVMNDEGEIVFDGLRDFAVAAPRADAILMTFIGDLTFKDDGWFSLYDAATGVILDGDVMSNEMSDISSLFWVTTDAETGAGLLLAQRRDAINIYTLDLEGSLRGFHSRGFLSGVGARAVYGLAGNINEEGADEISITAPGFEAAVLYTIKSAGFVNQRTVDRFLLGLRDVNADGLTDALALPTQGEANVTGVSSTAYSSIPRIEGFSRDGRYAFANWSFYSDDLPHSYLVRDGEFILYRDVPGLGEDFRVVAINDNGTIAGYILAPRETGDHAPVRVGQAVIINGVRRELIDFIAGVQGPTLFDVDKMVFKGVGPNGDFLIEEDREEGTPRAWVLTSGGLLIFLWNGFVEDQATDGTVLGTEREVGDDVGVTRLWHRQTGRETIPGLFNARRINDDHVIFGTDGANDLVVFRDDRVTLVARAESLVGGLDDFSWTIYGVDDHGRGVVRLNWLARRGRSWNGYNTYVIENNNSIARLDSRIVEGAIPDGLDKDGRVGWEQGKALITLFNTGDVVVRLGGATLLTQVDTPAGLTADTRGVRSVTAGSTSMTVIAVNPDGIPVSFRLADDKWQGRALTGLSGTLSPDGDLAVFVDPKDGRTHAVTLGRVLDGKDEGKGTVTLYREQADGSFGEPVTLNDTSFASSAIVTRLTVFTSTDGRVHIVGLNEDAQLIMFFQTGQGIAGEPGRWEWFFENVQLTHLEPNGQTTPQWVDELTVYVAPWNGLNIAGLTASGEVEVVWWAPGQKSWAADNLSKITGLTQIVGGLTSYVTGWGGLNVAGIDADGDLQVVWWIPGFENQWRASNMTREFDGQRLDPATISSYVTPWGGLNIAGIDTDTGAPVVYWWAPTMTDWVPDLVSFDRDPRDPMPTGRLIATNFGQQLNLFGRADTGEVIRLYWNPGDGEVWGLESLSRIAT